MRGCCPATTQMQSLGGLSTWAHVLPLHVLKHEEDARPTTTWTHSLGVPFVEYKGCHNSDPLFTTYRGGISVIWVKDSQPFQCRYSHTAPRLPFHQQSQERNIYKCIIDQKHANYINYAWLFYPSHVCIHNTNISHIHSSSLPNADCKFLLVPFGGIGSTCSFLQWSCVTLASILTTDLTNLSHSPKFNATPFLLDTSNLFPGALK